MVFKLCELTFHLFVQQLLHVEPIISTHCSTPGPTVQWRVEIPLHDSAPIKITA